MESLQKLSLPPQALERIKSLEGDLKLLCAQGVFKAAIEGKTANPHITAPRPWNRVKVQCKRVFSITLPLCGFRIENVFFLFFSDIKSLHCNENWCLESQESVGRITSLVRG